MQAGAPHAESRWCESMHQRDQQSLLKTSCSAAGSLVCRGPFIRKRRASRKSRAQCACWSQSMRKETSRTPKLFPEHLCCRARQLTPHGRRDSNQSAERGVQPKRRPLSVTTSNCTEQASSNNSTRGANRDRKSTRLNSSHGYISYAVFCLKKKKKPGQLHTQSNTR